MAEVVLQKVCKRFDRTEVVREIDLTISDEEFVVLVGPSGCGKTTTLRMIAGLEEVSDGEIFIGGRPVTDISPNDRDVAMVFQNYALYPHMTVFDNMSFSLRLQRRPKAEIKQRVEEAARVLNISELLSRMPKQLSGGQMQRVAMGRAIVRQPRVYLFDEPLSNLDAKLRVQMRTEMKKLHQKLRTTTVYVTHDQVEAMTLADRVVVMNAGRIEQIGSAHEVYSRPRTRFVAGFIGSPSMNFLPCRVLWNETRLLVRLAGTVDLDVPAELSDRYQAQVERELVFGVRPEHVGERRHGGSAEGFSPLTAAIEVVEPLGMDVLVYFTIGGHEVCARVDPRSAPKAGQDMELLVDMRQAHLFDPKTDLVL